MRKVRLKCTRSHTLANREARINLLILELAPDFRTEVAVNFICIITQVQNKISLLTLLYKPK